MRQYISFFKLRFITNLQYRTAAIAGIFTQFFFGLLFIMVYLKFYETGTKNVAMNLEQTITYLWLQQALFSLIYFYHREKEIVNMIKNGDVAYELCRPGNVYIKWFARIYATRLASVLMKFLPIILVGILLPQPFKIIPPVSIYGLFGFLITLLLGSLLMASIDALLHVLTFYTIDADGILTSFRVVGELFAGGIVPVLFMPKFLQIISSYLPFQYINDVPFRLYLGLEDIGDLSIIIGIQLIWIIVIIAFGTILSKKALKKVVVQGG